MSPKYTVSILVGQAGAGESSGAVSESMDRRLVQCWRSRSRSRLSRSNPDTVSDPDVDLDADPDPGREWLPAPVTDCLFP